MSQDNLYEPQHVFTSDMLIDKLITLVQDKRHKPLIWVRRYGKRSSTWEASRSAPNNGIDTYTIRETGVMNQVRLYCKLTEKPLSSKAKLVASVQSVPLAMIAAEDHQRRIANSRANPDPGPGKNKAESQA